LQKLLEHHPIVGVFASGHADTVRLEALADGGMSKNVVGGGGFLDEPKSGI
jgi:hypothetical protein